MDVLLTTSDVPKLIAKRTESYLTEAEVIQTRAINILRVQEPSAELMSGSTSPPEASRQRRNVRHAHTRGDE